MTPARAFTGIPDAPPLGLEQEMPSVPANLTVRGKNIACTVSVGLKWSTTVLLERFHNDVPRCRQPHWDCLKFSKSLSCQSSRDLKLLSGGYAVRSSPFKSR
jgi:hypothetical protein